MFWTRLARWSCIARLTRRARRASGSGCLCIDALKVLNVLHAAVLLIHCWHRCNRTGLPCKHPLVLWHTGLTGGPRWTCLIRVARRSRLTRLALTCRPRLSALTRRTLLALRFGKRRINVAVYVPRFVIVVTAIIGIMHVIHFSEP